jgi:hypothetical protein
MAEGNVDDLPTSLEEFERWNGTNLRKYLEERGLPKNGKVKEVAAVAWFATVLKHPKVSTPGELCATRHDDYASRLVIPGTDRNFIDPSKDINNWIGEKKGMSTWPNVYISDIAT